MNHSFGGGSFNIQINVVSILLNDVGQRTYNKGFDQKKGGKYN